MFASALRIALAKTDDQGLRTALEQALARAESLAHVEAHFESKINASKASRGEKPTKLSKARRAQLSEYDNDASTLAADQLASFEAQHSAIEIVFALKSGLDVDVQFWATAPKYTHPGDLPVVQEFVTAKLELLESLARCLAQGNTSAE